MEDLKKARKNKEEKKFYNWMNHLVTNALEKDEVEDYFYEYRWEFIDEDSKRMWVGLYSLWSAILNKRSKEEIEALYQKGYRFIHKLGQKNVFLKL